MGKMPGLTRKVAHTTNSSSQSPASGSSPPIHTGLWCRLNNIGVTMSQLQSFWDELPLDARHKILRIDKQNFFEQVRKNLYCSRCNGLLLEGFSQIALHSKRIQEGLLNHNCSANCDKKRCKGADKEKKACLQDDTRDPFVHAWGGLTATRDNMLTILDCFIDGQPFGLLQNAFDSARARERGREILYPDACGGGGRGWISQSTNNSASGRGHGLKEACALHTSRLSCEALVDFWSALGEETRNLLLRMKEDDFIEKLMLRFESKRFCRDCRRNVLREFKELKELKRTRREPRCSRWFCAADTGFRYEVLENAVQVDWKECFAGDTGHVYDRFEWGIGTAEGKDDILNFENVGLSEGAQVEGIDFGDLPSIFITLRAWKWDGRCSEISVKAHALNGQLCVHRRLVVGDGYVTITKGDSIHSFFEHAEETEEEEDDEATDKDMNEIDSEASQMQKHAKSPELAREFLLDAATVIFKEQVEKAFREGTARQNGHSLFISLALSLLEERMYVACKEITTLEIQNKLLAEEEEKKREEEERRERKRLKEKERKLRRKEKLRGKDREKEKVKGEERLAIVNGSVEEASADKEDRADDICSSYDQEEKAVTNDATLLDTVQMADNEDVFEFDNASFEQSASLDGIGRTSQNDLFMMEQSEAVRRRSKMRKGSSLEGVSGRFWKDGGFRFSPRNFKRAVSTCLAESPAKLYYSQKHRVVSDRWLQVCDRCLHEGGHQCACRCKFNPNHNIRSGRLLYQKKKVEKVHTTGTRLKHVQNVESVSSNRGVDRQDRNPETVPVSKTDRILEPTEMNPVENAVVFDHDLTGIDLASSISEKVSPSPQEKSVERLRLKVVRLPRSPTSVFESLSKEVSERGSDGDLGSLSSSCITDTSDTSGFEFSTLESPSKSADRIAVATDLPPPAMYQTHESNQEVHTSSDFEKQTGSKSAMQPAFLLPEHNALESFALQGDATIHRPSPTMGMTHRMLDETNISASVFGSSVCPPPDLRPSFSPLHHQQGFGYYEVRGEWVASGFIPLSHSNGYLMTRPCGYGPTTLGLQQNSSLPFLPPFPGFPVGSNFMKLDFNVYSRVDQMGASANTCRNEMHYSSSLRYSSFRDPGGVRNARLDPSSFGGKNPTSVDMHSQLKDTSGFSLFHFGGPSVTVEERSLSSTEIRESKSGSNLTIQNMACCRSLQQQGVEKTNMPVEEYSLFAATPNSRFSFF